MIRDITIGQYFPGQSALHKMDPRIKILLSILYIVMLFVADNMCGLVKGVGFGLEAYRLESFACCRWRLIRGACCWEWYLAWRPTSSAAFRFR